MIKQRVPRGYGKIAIRTRNGRVVLPSPVKGPRTINAGLFAQLTPEQQKTALRCKPKQTVMVRGRAYWRAQAEIQRERISRLADLMLEPSADLKPGVATFLGELLTQQDLDAAYDISVKRMRINRLADEILSPEGIYLAGFVPGQMVFLGERLTQQDLDAAYLIVRKRLQKKYREREESKMTPVRLIGRDKATGKLHQAMRAENDPMRWRWLALDCNGEDDPITYGDFVMEFDNIETAPQQPPATTTPTMIRG